MTVTCKLVGGLGNCLFIIATTIAYSLKHGIEYCIPKQVHFPHTPGQEVFYSYYLKYCSLIDTSLGYQQVEKTFEYEEIPAIDAEQVLLIGYYQSYKYFQDYRPEILTMLNIPKAIGYGKVFLHYRLGDYKDLGKFHKIISEEYLTEALKMIYDKGYRNIIVFSDEIELIKQKLWTDSRFKWEFSEGRSEIQDLALMAACAGGIMSASSFSWWGAWLGDKDRTVIYPKDWFGEEMNHDIKDLCPKEWIAL